MRSSASLPKSRRSRTRVFEDQAREIFGRNFFGNGEWIQYYESWESDVNKFTPAEHRAIKVLPWTKEQLTAPCPFHRGKCINETHFLFLGRRRLDRKPLTIMRLHERHPYPSQPFFFTYQAPEFPPGVVYKFNMRDMCNLRWYLMPLEAIPRTFNQPYDRQLELLPPAYEVPRPVEEVLKVILYYVRNGVYLNSTCKARCRDIQPDGKQVQVGDFDFNGLNVNFQYAECGLRYIGLAASRIPHR
jgi:hypothetical protein